MLTNAATNAKIVKPTNMFIFCLTEYHDATTPAVARLESFTASSTVSIETENGEIADYSLFFNLAHFDKGQAVLPAIRNNFDNEDFILKEHHLLPGFEEILNLANDLIWQRINRQNDKVKRIVEAADFDNGDNVKIGAVIPPRHADKIPAVVFYAIGKDNYYVSMAGQFCVTLYGKISKDVFMQAIGLAKVTCNGVTGGQVKYARDLLAIAQDAIGSGYMDQAD